MRQQSKKYYALLIKIHLLVNYLIIQFGLSSFEELDVPCIIVGEESTCRNAATIKKILCANQNTAACQ